MESLKSNDRYLYYRVYCSIVLLAGNALALWIFIDNQSFKYFLIFFPFEIPAIVMLCNLGIFPLKYSIFGPNKRTPFPQEPEFFKKVISSGRIGWFRNNGARLFSIHLFQSGIGLSFTGGAKAFIPKDNLLALKKQRMFGYELNHTSPELRNPIVFYDRDVFEKIQSLKNSKDILPDWEQNLPKNVKTEIESSVMIKLGQAGVIIFRLLFMLSFAVFIFDQFTDGYFSWLFLTAFSLIFAFISSMGMLASYGISKKKFSLLDKALVLSWICAIFIIPIFTSLLRSLTS